MRLAVVSVVVITSRETSGSHDEAIGVCNWQDIGGFGLLAPWIGDGCAAFLGTCVRTIQVELGQVQPRLDGGHASLPNLFQAAILAPLAEVGVHRLPTDFFF